MTNHGVENITAPASAHSPLVLPKWNCAKHRESDAIGIQFYWPSKPPKNYCLECYHELIAANCCEVFPVATEASS